MPDEHADIFTDHRIRAMDSRPVAGCSSALAFGDREACARTASRRSATAGRLPTQRVSGRSGSRMAPTRARWRWAHPDRRPCDRVPSPVAGFSGDRKSIRPGEAFRPTGRQGPELLRLMPALASVPRGWKFLPCPRMRLTPRARHVETVQSALAHASAPSGIGVGQREPRTHAERGVCAEVWWTYAARALETRCRG